ncbi:23S rRNA pseudouridine(2604) synthase RluF [Membranihabitans marinus]|uniref:23S rRNA pseudouridine(2604) synthase RluF n=1 Tax=Membranihabitans marinus TaxID=1227546 RepID=UPI0021BD16FF|nr:23S rRNA pseudouridine(2604) synthase RluF [Membranihabitans marinus]
MRFAIVNKVSTPNQDSISLNKYISSTGICSRREADRMIDDGRVLLNGQIAQRGNRVFDGDQVTLDGKPIGSKPREIYIALNKPVGIVSTTDSREPANIIRFVNHPERLFHIGRLDKDSQGLILLTNNGDIVNKVLRAGNNHDKEYIVTVDQNITNRFLVNMRKGVHILGTRTKKCTVIKLNSRQFKIILVEGMNRQIRRMCKHLGYNVLKLKRVRIMHLTLEGLNTGDWRELTPQEIHQLKELVSGSAKDVK